MVTKNIINLYVASRLLKHGHSVNTRSVLSMSRCFLVTEDKKHDQVEWLTVDVEPRCVIVGLTRHALLLFVTLGVPLRCEVTPNEAASLSPPSPHQ
jgi:hypothetical protein